MPGVGEGPDNEDLALAASLAPQAPMPWQDDTTPWVSEVPVMEEEARCIMAQRRCDLEADGGALTRSGSSETGDICGGAACSFHNKPPCAHDTVHGATAALLGHLPRELAMAIAAFSAPYGREAWLVRTVLRTKARRLITAFLGPDTEGFWVCAGPEQLICLCRGLELVSPRAAAEDVLGGASLDEGGALKAQALFFQA